VKKKPLNPFKIKRGKVLSKDDKWAIALIKRALKGDVDAIIEIQDTLYLEIK